MRYSDTIVKVYPSSDAKIEFNLLNLTEVNFEITIFNPNGLVDANITFYDRNGAPISNFTLNSPAIIKGEYTNISKIVIQDSNNYQIYISYTYIYYSSEKEMESCKPSILIQPLALDQIHPNSFINIIQLDYENNYAYLSTTPYIADKITIISSEANNTSIYLYGSNGVYTLNPGTSITLEKVNLNDLYVYLDYGSSGTGPQIVIVVAGGY